MPVLKLVYYEERDTPKTQIGTERGTNKQKKGELYIYIYSLGDLTVSKAHKDIEHQYNVVHTGNYLRK